MANLRSDMESIRRRCSDREVRDLLIGAVKAGVRYRCTKSGIMFYTNSGIFTAHYTPSDHRAAKNLRARLKSAGIEI